ncbi:MAG: hypothetical protein LUE16_06705 [Lachnospiraceae bacterium]|nr:hypothetical protein [Lachnospiraceae bacterium]
MERATYLGSAVTEAAQKAQYDAYAKELLADRTVLAWILKYTVKEFADCEIDEIRNCIDTPQIGCVPVVPGRQPEKVIGDRTEDKVPDEGVVYYDIRFHAYTPGKERIKVIVNLEAQGSFYPGYDLVTRGVFYGARLLSAQMDTEFTGEDYDEIKPVYSIFICMATPKYAKDTITEYSISPKTLHGNYHGRARYDIMTVVMICLTESADSKSRLIGMLSTLLSREMDTEEKKQLLSEEFEIPMSVNMKEVMGNMCNLSDLLIEDGVQLERKRNEKELAKMVKNLMMNLNCTAEQAFNNLGLSEDVRKSVMKNL